MGTAKQIPIRRCVTVFQEGKLVNFDIVNLLGEKTMGVDAECILLSFGELGVCNVLASGWRWHGAKYH